MPLARFAVVLSLIGALGIAPSLYAGMHWRFVGPLRGGRTTSIAGVRRQTEPLLHRCRQRRDLEERRCRDDTWTPIFDAQSTGSIGALAVAASDPQRRLRRQRRRPAASGSSGRQRHLQVDRRRSDVDATRSARRSANRVDRRRCQKPEPALRRRARPPVRTERTTRRLPLARRRRHVQRECFTKTPTRRRVRRRARSARPQHRLCDALGGTSSPVGNRRVVRNSGERHLQIHRRRNDVDAVDGRAPAADRPRRNRVPRRATPQIVYVYADTPKREAARSIAATTPARILRQANDNAGDRPARRRSQSRWRSIRTHPAPSI